MDEVEYSNVMKTESGRGCDLGRGGHRPGGYSSILLERCQGKRGILQSRLLCFLNIKKRGLKISFFHVTVM
jgi:hypothetical protein